LHGRVILVTGAAGGLGSAAAQAIAVAGAEVILLGHKLKRLEKTYDAIIAAGGRAWLYPLDLEGATPGDYAALAQRIGEGPGRLDGLLHAAAAFRGLTPIEHSDPERIAGEFKVNLTAPLWLTRACWPLLAAAEDSAIVFCVNQPSRAHSAYWGGYGLAQSALHGLIPMLQAEAPRGPVRVSGLQPGPMRTPLRARAYAIEHDQIARPARDYAAHAVYLLSAQAQAWRGRVLDAERDDIPASAA
jgi:NAD(P)-dependent dehydrogenase (short-subunit alcohol dehydrogenase family)